MSGFVIPKTVNFCSLLCKEYCTTLPLQIVFGETFMTHNILCSLGYTFVFMPNYVGNVLLFTKQARLM